MLVMEDHNWPESWSLVDISTYQQGMRKGDEALDLLHDLVASPVPVSINSMGDGETAAWAYSRLLQHPEIQPLQVDRLLETNGMYYGQDRMLWPLLDAAYSNSPHWFVIGDWPLGVRLTMACMQSMGVTITPERFEYKGQSKTKVHMNALFDFAVSGRLEKALAVKRVALWGGKAHQLARKFIEHGRVNIVAVQDWPVDFTADKLPHVAPGLKHLLSTQWDVLLTSLGGLGPVVGEYVRQCGRTAYDLGSGDNLILTGKRYP